MSDKTKTILSVRMTTEEKKAIEARAKKLGLTVREYLTRPADTEGLEALENRLRAAMREDLNIALTQFKTEQAAKDEAFRKNLFQFFKQVLS